MNDDDDYVVVHRRATGAGLVLTMTLESTAIAAASTVGMRVADGWTWTVASVLALVPLVLWVAWCVIRTRIAVDYLTDDE